MKWNRPEDIAKINPLYFATSAANTPLFLTGTQQQIYIKRAYHAYFGIKLGD